MAKPEPVTDKDFVRDFVRYRREAELGPLAIVSEGQIAGYFLQPEDFDALMRLRSSRRSFATVDLPDDKAEAIANGRMDPRHDHLDALLDSP